MGDTWCVVTASSRIPLYMPCRDGAVIIDSGLKMPAQESLLSLLEQEHIRIASILTSHFHRDHVGNHQTLREAYGATVYYSPLVAALQQHPESAKGIAFGTVATLLPSAVPESGVELILPTDEAVNAAGYDFKILNLPGHASEHMGFVTPDGVAYLGDIILSQDLLETLRLPYCEDYIRDIQAKRSVLQMNYPKYILAHNGVYDDIQEITLRNIENQEEKAAFVEGLLDDFICLEDLTAKFLTVTGGSVNVRQKIEGFRHNLQKVLQYLVAEDRVTVQARNGYVEYGRTGRNLADDFR